MSYLDFHYRSKNPKLINFSNAAFYDSRLIPMPAKVEGAMAALAGLLVYTVQNGFPDLENGWLPPSALTSAELEDERVRFAAECDGEEVAA